MGFPFFVCFPFCSLSLQEESLPVTKNPGDGVYSGSTCKHGEIEGVVVATGVHTFFGKAAHLVETTTHVGHFQQVLPVFFSWMEDSLRFSKAGRMFSTVIFLKNFIFSAWR